MSILSPRQYQLSILETAKNNNTLVVLPTGLGKTLIALLLSIHRKKQYPLSKILFLAPTRPLVDQHLQTFKKELPELFADLQIFTGTTSAEKRKKIWQTAEIIFSTPQCVDGETLIFTEKGPIKISQFFEKFKFEQIDSGKVAEIKERVLGYDGQKIKFLEASKAWKLAGKGLIKLKTEIGNNLICTKDHSLLTISPEGKIFWKEASQLDRGDYIASIKRIEIEEGCPNLIELISSNKSLKVTDDLLIKRLMKKLKEKKLNCSAYSRYNYNFMPLDLFLELARKTDINYNSLSVTDNCGKSSPVKLPNKINFRLSYILGAMLGDGHLGNRKGHGGEVVFSDLDRESVRNEFKEAIKETFGVSMKETPKGLVAYNSALASILSSLGIPKGSKAKIIQIPKFLFFTDAESIKGFIKGLFDTDGSASKYGVSISSVSERFMQELKWLLLKINILGNIGKTKNRGVIKNRKIKESDIFTLRFSGRKNLQKFLEVSPDKDKCKKLIETLNNTKRPETRSKEIIPVPELMKKIRKKNKGKIEYYKFSCLSLDNLKKLSEKIRGEEASKLKELINLPIRWVKIKEKQEDNEEKEVYDLTIEKHHNFIANCIINHNCISNDLKNFLYNLSDVSLLIFDEAHRCLKNYSYTHVVNYYKKQSNNTLILGLTASPGSEPEKIREICKHLDIKAIESRSRESDDVKPYLQELEFKKIEVPFPQEFQEIKVLLKIIYNNVVEALKRKNLLFGPANKITLLQLQSKLAIQAEQNDWKAMQGMSLTAQAIKISHAVELLETQTLAGLNSYLNSLIKQANEQKSKAVQRLVAQKEFQAALLSLNHLLKNKIEHPKIEELAVLIENELKNNSNAKIIIFTQFRDTASVILNRLKQLPNTKPSLFIGQAKKANHKNETIGMDQKKQKQIIQDFKDNNINILIATSIGEEGLDIPEVNAVIFYEPIPSAIRKIQRAGRTARLSPGKLIILMTKDTRDIAFHYASTAKEKKMHRTLEQIQQELKNNKNQLNYFM